MTFRHRLNEFSQKKIIQESLDLLLEYKGGLVFHGTTLHNAIEILRDNRIGLSDNTRSTEEFANKGNEKYKYFLSTSRTKEKATTFTPFFYKSIDIVLNLDGQKLQNNLKSAPVQFHPPGRREVERQEIIQGKFVSGISTHYDENEQRYFSNKSEVSNASKFIQEIHLFTHTPFNEARGELRRRIKHILFYSVKRNVKLYHYSNRTHWLSQVKAKAHTPSKANIEKIKTWAV